MTYPPVSASSTSSWRITSSVSPSMVGSFFEATRVPTTRPSSTGRPRSLLRRGHVPAHDGRHVAAARLLVRDELHLRRLDHRVGRLDHCRKPAALDHSQCFSHEFLLSLL